MTEECCLTHGLILPCQDCVEAAMASAVCPTCKAPTGNHEVDEEGNHFDPNECSVLLNVASYREEEIRALELDPANYPMPKPVAPLWVKKPGPVRSPNPNCNVLGCYLPRDEQFRDDTDGYFCWCTLHGEWHAVRDALHAEWEAKIDAAHKEAGLTRG